MTEIVTDLVLEYIGDHANLLDSFTCLYGCFVGCLFLEVGLEFGAHFVQTLVERYVQERNKALAQTENQDQELLVSSKRCSNYITLLSYLYCFQVVRCGLMYDLIRLSIDELSELDVEVLMRIIKVAGYQLRTDDPTSLKDIVAKVREQVSKKDQKTLRFKITNKRTIKVHG